MGRVGIMWMKHLMSRMSLHARCMKTSVKDGISLRVRRTFESKERNLCVTQGGLRGAGW
jgi:hypothetical protein